MSGFDAEKERREANAAVDAYLDRMCARIKAEELHPELREEMRGHIDELASGKEDAGASPLEAASWALAQMGDADEVGGTLGRVHRPKFNWRLLIPLAAIAAIGLLALFSAGAAYADGRAYAGLGSKQMFYYAVGSVLLAGFYFFDYRLLRKYAAPLYGIAALGMVLGFRFLTLPMNGDSRWIMIAGQPLDWALCMFFLFAVSLPGLLDRLNLPGFGAFSGRQIAAIALILLPVGLFAYFRLTAWLSLLLYVVSALILYVRAGGLKRYVYAAAAGMAGFAAVMLTHNPIWKSRFGAVFAPQLQNADTLYTNEAMAKAFREAGWFGQGYASAPELPYAYADTVFAYLTYSFGWIVAAAAAVSIAWLLRHLLHAALAPSDRYGRLLAAGIAIPLAGQWIYGLGASLNLLPFTSILLPFVSYGGTSSLYHFAAIGLILGIYRRKDLIPRAQREPFGVAGTKKSSGADA
ncbi:FtsW/RodA/SpoVE family cell cycle protein [Saccharibacillus alkalitolerans]|uniref:FtsW/RodA/SpoVE family cell cycle protein n=1 Tax=Saccharibacillus alkalitolerans TaxID=2705290 RepID=A0ABX0FC63_9BACL|nr:FtsW/RodA/SpoVE family cell cycle protein [Saccharibacillus alkalitolerans]NGZ77965.1 FtsW/RodA/SpoVE family cell cycle protein [Saccharibacillus alkalitolerans]